MVLELNKSSLKKNQVFRIQINLIFLSKIPSIQDPNISNNIITGDNFK